MHAKMLRQVPCILLSGQKMLVASCFLNWLIQEMGDVSQLTHSILCFEHFKHKEFTAKQVLLHHLRPVLQCASQLLLEILLPVAPDLRQHLVYRTSPSPSPLYLNQPLPLYLAHLLHILSLSSPFLFPRPLRSAYRLKKCSNTYITQSLPF